MATDVVVIGGGVIGLATAHELLRLGARVTILERSYCGKESSWAGGGILSPLLPWDYHDSVTQLVQLSKSGGVGGGGSSLDSFLWREPSAFSLCNEMMSSKKICGAS